MRDVQDHLQPLAVLTGWRARAQMKRDDWGPVAPLYAVEGQAVMDTVDWLTGVTVTGPATDEDHVATEDTVADELMRALDDEHAVRGTDASWRPGAIARTLKAYTDPRAEPPV
jgi:hypothetical protein